MARGSLNTRRLTEYHDEARDQFDRPVTNVLHDLINVPGEHDFTPERLRYYKDGTRRFLEYGSDANYSETNTGHLLEPDGDQTLTLELAERTAYPVGFDLWPSLSRRVTQPLQAGDAVGGGYGTIDLASFDPSTQSWSGTDADGWFWMHTAETGLDEVLLIGVRNGTVFDSRTFRLQKHADTLSIVETRLNWYGVGPALTRESYTDIADFPERPQRNRYVGAIANDDGKAAAKGSQRVTLAVHQAAGNSGLGLEAGSMSIKASGEPNYQFKSKGHSMDLEVTDATADVYQVCGALRIDPGRPNVKLRINDMDIISTPGSATTRTRVLIVAIDPSETDFADGDFVTPPEHNQQNSVLEEAEDNTATGPALDGTEDVTGATLSNTMTDPGGYQIGRESVTPEGQGSASVATTGEQIGNRNLYDTDYALILVDGSETGTCEVDINTAQNS